MLTITIADLFDNTLPESGWGKFCVYIFRDNDFVLYVGKTENNIIDRLEAHLGITYRSQSLVGKLIEDNAPESHQWQIDLLTLDDCAPFIARHFPTSKETDVRLAEQAMILEYCPPLNRESNPHARALPSAYTSQKESRIQAAFRKVFNVKE